VSLEDRLYPLLALYHRMPRRVQYALGSAYAHLPQRWRLGARYSEFSEIAAEGAEAEAAVGALSDLVTCRFDEER